VDAAVPRQADHDDPRGGGGGEGFRGLHEEVRSALMDAACAWTREHWAALIDAREAGPAVGGAG
jgi:hypothetical protein